MVHSDCQMSDHSESRCLALFFDLLVLSAVLVATSAQAADEPKIPHWYEVITGIIAIPAALIGLAYSLIKKTRLESRKTELEILEKERQLSQVAPTVSRATLSDFISAPAGGNRLILLLLLRFVILYLVLTAWGVHY